MFEFAEYIGIIAFGISGFLVASKNNLDYLGIFISAFLTALGGGIIRDIIINKLPFSFTNTTPGVLVLAVFTLMLFFKLHKFSSLESKPLFIISDSIGLVSFSITGALIALEYKLNFTGVLALSFITAVGGGIARDVIINEVLFVFKTGFYGTVSLLIGLIIYLISLFFKINFFMLSFILIFGVFLRLLAYYKRWNIPRLKP